MFNKLFSRDHPAAKAYHAAKLNAAGNPQFATTVLEYAPRKSAEEVNRAIDQFAASVRAQLADQPSVQSGRMATSSR